MRVDSSGTRYGFWHIESDGKLDITQWITYESFYGLLSMAAWSNVSWSNIPMKPPKRLDGQIVQQGEPVFDRAQPSDIGSLVAVFRSSLKIQDQKDVEGRFYLYKATDGDLPVDAMFVPEIKAEEDWAVVISDRLLSPQGPWRAMTRADLDGDGVKDTAFVAKGFDGCDRTMCPLDWVVMLLTRPQSQGPIEDTVLLNTTSFGALLDRCSQIKNYVVARKKQHWKTTTTDCGLAISMSSPGCEMNWTFSRGADGRIRRLSDLPFQ